MFSARGYHTALYRFMGAVAADPRVGAGNAEYATFLASKMPASIVNELCPFDAVAVSTLWRGAVQEYPYGWGDRWRLWRQARELVRASRAVVQYLPPVSVGSAWDDDAMKQILQQWIAVTEMTPAVYRRLIQPMTALLGGAHVLARMPEQFGYLSAAMVEVDDVNDAVLLADFDVALVRFLRALTPLLR